MDHRQEGEVAADLKDYCLFIFHFLFSFLSFSSLSLCFTQPASLFISIARAVIHPLSFCRLFFNILFRCNNETILSFLSLSLPPPTIHNLIKVLDIGCNSGDFTVEFAKTFHAASVKGVDIDRALVARVRDTAE